MSENQNNIELIEQFFRQELSEEELLAFENRVRQDPEFSKEVIHMRDVFYGVKWAARLDLKEELKEIQKNALSQGTKPYKPTGLKGFKWLKWFTGLVITAAIVGIGFTYFNNKNIIHLKSYFVTEDSIPLNNNSIKKAPPGDTMPAPEGPTLIKDPSDPRYQNMPADINLQVKDPNTFKIKKIGMDENGLYTYEIQADGETHIVSSTNPELVGELMKKKEENISTTSRNKILRDTVRTKIERAPIEGIDF